MIFTARQLQELHKSNGHVTLPADARLTPLANDWLRSRGVSVEYRDLSPTTNGSPAAPPLAAPTSSTSTTAGGFSWWCDGPCGVAKAAIAAHLRESRMTEIAISSEPVNIAKVLKQVAQAIQRSQCAGAILLVKSSAAAAMLANRCTILRAVVATSRQSVEQAKRDLSANVLIIEYPNQTISQVRNYLAIFTKLSAALSEQSRRELEEMTRCA